LPIKSARGTPRYPVEPVNLRGETHNAATINHPPHGLSNLGFCQSAKTKANIRPRSVVEGESLGGKKNHAFRGGALSPGLNVDAGVNSGPDRHTSGRHPERNSVAELPQQLRGQQIAAALIDSFGAANVTLHVAIAEQLGNRALHRMIALPIGIHAMRGNALPQRLRRHQVPEPQARRKDLRQAADIRYDAPVHTGQWKHGPAVVMELVVIIVFDNHETMFSCECQ
jgi:hypothetical protein